MASTTVSKKKVAEVAMRYARKNGWCDEIKKALEELGIEPPTPPKVRLVLEIPLEDLTDGYDDGEDFAENRVWTDDDRTAALTDCLRASGYSERAEWLKEYRLLDAS